MHSQDTWSVSIGRWVGIPVRIHLALLFLILAFWSVEWHFVRMTPEMGGIAAGTWIATSIALLLAITIHELGHIFAAVNLGGSVRQVILSPWAGRSDMVLPRSTRAQAVVYFAGPFVNLMVFTLTAALLLNLGHANLEQLVDPFHPNSLRGQAEIAFMRIFCWCNFQLFLINCIPAFPFDASYLLRLFIRAQNPAINANRLETAVMAVAHMVGIALFVLAWFSQDFNEGPLQPTWAYMAAFGLAIIFASRFEFFRQMSEYQRARVIDQKALGSLEDFGAMYDEEFESFEFEEDQSESISQWLRQKQEERQTIEREIEQDEDKRVDAILEKMHRDGSESLNEEERATLQRVSDRWRRRRRREQQI